jgi:hypothetical protein
LTEADLKMLIEEFARLRRECNTKEKAIAQLQSEGLLDENGETAAMYRVPAGEEHLWQ